MKKEIKDNLLKILQYDFPVSTTPWRDIGKKLGVSENEVLEMVGDLKKEGIIRRIGAILAKEKLGFRSLLVALKAKDNCMDEVVTYLNSLEAVTHNYLREGEWNLWFTFSYFKEEELHELKSRIEDFSCVEDILILPATKTYKIDARF